MPWSRLSRFIGDGHTTFHRNPYDEYINPYYWVDDHPLLYGNNGSLDPSTYSHSTFPIKKRSVHVDIHGTETCILDTFMNAWFATVGR